LFCSRQQNGKVIVRVGFFGFDPKSCFKLLHCAIHVASLTEGSAEIHTRSNTVGPGCHSFAKLSRSVRIPLRLKRYFAAAQVQTLSGNQVLQTIDDRIRYSYANRSLLREMCFNFLRITQTTISHRQ
jgi:hypothetical protein